MMFSKFDILSKEIDNETFRTECVIECISMDIDNYSSSDYVIESEGFIETIKNKVLSIIKKIGDTVKSVIVKISNFFTSSKIKMEYDELLDEAKELEKRTKQAFQNNSELKDRLEKCKIEEFDYSGRISDVKRLSDYVIAGAKTVVSKIKGGKAVSPDEIRKIREDALNKWDEKGLDDTTSDEYKKYCKVKTIHDIIDFLLPAGIIGSTVTAIQKFSGNSIDDSIFCGATAGALSGLVSTLIANGHLMKNAVSTAAARQTRDAYAKAEESGSKLLSAQATAIASLGTVIQQAECMTYRKAVRYLKSSIRDIKSTLKDIERLGAEADADIYNANAMKRISVATRSK